MTTVAANQNGQQTRRWQGANRSADYVLKARSVMRAARTRRVILFLGVVVSLLTLRMLTPHGEDNSESWRHHHQTDLRWDRLVSGEANTPVVSSDGDAIEPEPEVTPLLKWVMPTGMADFTDGVILAQPDVELDETQNVSGFLPYDVAGANGVLRSLQSGFPDAGTALAERERFDHQILEPELSYDQMQALAARNGRLVRIRLFDTCLSDGDIVDVYFGGQPWATVLLTEEGSEVFVPLDLVYFGNNIIEIQPVSEGTSPGITIGLETSQGIGFVRTLTEDGHSVELNVINPTLFSPAL